jgi:hypothetical protein
MSYVLNLYFTEDQYTAAGTLIFDQRVGRITLDVYNAGIFYSLQSGVNGINASDNDGNWGPDTFCGPSFRSLSRSCTGIQVRSALSGTPAIVNLEGIPSEELGE